MSVKSIGIAAGLCVYLLALGATALTLAVLLLLSWFEKRIERVASVSEP